MEFSDTQLLESFANGDQETLEDVLNKFIHGDRKSYNLLIKALKCSDLLVERALRSKLVEKDLLVEELVCQAYYPFVKSICSYKFNDRSLTEIEQITNDVLGKFVKEADKFPDNSSMRNILYQRICEVRKNTADFELNEDCDYTDSNKPSPKDKENAVSDETKSSSKEQGPIVNGGSSTRGLLNKPRRHSSGGHQVVIPVVGQAKNEKNRVVIPLKSSETQPLPADYGDINNSNSTAPSEDKLNEDQDDKSSEDLSQKLITLLLALSERDFDTYRIVVLHYFKRHGYQDLCRDMKGCNIVYIGKKLCVALLKLGKSLLSKRQMNA